VVSGLFDARTNSFLCEDCKIEIIEHDPAANSTGGQEKMQSFNIATQDIRDALKRLEGLTLPSLNIMAWIAQNVKAEVVGVDAAGEEEKKFQVVLGGEEKDLLEKERLQEAQRYVYPLGTGLMPVFKTPCLFGIHIPQSQELLPHWVYQTKQESRLSLPIGHDQLDKEMTKMRMICSKLITLRWKMKPSLLMCRCLQSAWRPV
jgi:hypothetical protein